MSKRIYLCLAHMSGKEQQFIQEAFDTNWVVPLGPNVNGFEDDLKQFVNTREGASTLDKEIVALSAGTAAIHLALIACGVKAGDEVICQSFTFCASANPVTYLGATPVFVDSEADSWNIDPALLEQAIIDRKAKTGKLPKAIIPVALYGMPYRIEEIKAIADKYGIPVIEDAAEGMGSRWKGQVLGTFGEYGILSFNGNKMITTSGGGALICKDVESKQRIMWLATQAREAYPYYQHEAIGYNYRLSNICAGIGRGQMTILDEHIAHHKHIAQRYREAFAEIEGITFRLRRELLAVHSDHRRTGAYPRRGEGIRRGGTGSSRRSSRCRTWRWQCAYGLRTEQERGGSSYVPRPSRHRESSAMEADAQTAGVQRLSGVPQRRERGYVPSRNMSAQWADGER